MILAFDVYYTDNAAKTVCIAFENWADTTYSQATVEYVSPVAEYESGAFYKRELPCIMQVLQKMDLAAVTAIVVDGYVWLDDAGTPGLGAHLYEALGRTVPVIGVAKTNFAKNTQNRITVLRGESGKPLYVTAIGCGMEEAAAQIRNMHGEYRMPALLKELDRITKDDSQ